MSTEQESSAVESGNLEKHREGILNKLETIFREKAIESHIFGSLARGTADQYSDVDVWFTFKDEDIKDILAKRLEFYAQAGEVVHVCEPPQNRPAGGVHSFVLYKTSAGLQQIDVYLCPQSSSFMTEESKKVFGDVDLPKGELGLNPDKILVPESYKIDFLITFIFIAIKQLIRQKDYALDQLFFEYNKLADKGEIKLEPIANQEKSFSSLKQIITNVDQVANDQQKKVLSEILGFVNQVEAE